MGSDKIIEIRITANATTAFSVDAVKSALLPFMSVVSFVVDDKAIDRAIE